jgi:hypothetical protein
MTFSITTKARIIPIEQTACMEKMRKRYLGRKHARNNNLGTWAQTGQ